MNTTTMITFPRQGGVVSHTGNCPAVTRALAPNSQTRNIRFTTNPEAIAKWEPRSTKCGYCQKQEVAS